MILAMFKERFAQLNSQFKINVITTVKICFAILDCVASVITVCEGEGCNLEGYKSL